MLCGVPLWRSSKCAPQDALTPFWPKRFSIGGAHCMKEALQSLMTNHQQRFLYNQSFDAKDLLDLQERDGSYHTSRFLALWDPIKHLIGLRSPWVQDFLQTRLSLMCICQIGLFFAQSAEMRSLGLHCMLGRRYWYMLQNLFSSKSLRLQQGMLSSRTYWLIDWLSQIQLVWKSDRYWPLQVMAHCSAPAEAVQALGWAGNGRKASQRWIPAQRHAAAYKATPDKSRQPGGRAMPLPWSLSCQRLALAKLALEFRGNRWIVVAPTAARQCMAGDCCQPLNANKLAFAENLMRTVFVEALSGKAIQMGN